MCHYEGKELCDGGEKNWKGAENVAEVYMQTDSKGN